MGQHAGLNMGQTAGLSMGQPASLNVVQPAGLSIGQAVGNTESLKAVLNTCWQRLFDHFTKTPPRLFFVKVKSGRVKSWRCGRADS